MSLDIFKGLFSDIWSILLVVLFFGGSIFVHELGHFLAARRRGLIVERFSIGFGPKLFSWVRGGVEYRISLLPLGGYVALPQLAEMGPIEGKSKRAQLPPISYTDKMIVSVMGAVFNFIFAFILAVILWTVGQPSSMQQETTVIGYVAETLSVDEDKSIVGPAFKAGLRAGDTILEIDGNAVSNFKDILEGVATGSERTADGLPLVNFTVLREKERLKIPVVAQMVKLNKYSDQRFRMVGISPAQSMKIGAVSPYSPAEKLGIQKEDVLLSVDDTPIFALATLQHYLEKHPNQTVALKVSRDGKILTFPIVAKPVPYTKPLIQLEVEQPFVSIKFVPMVKADYKGDPADMNAPSVLVVYEKLDPFSSLSKVQFKDVLQSVDGRPIQTLQSFLEVTKENSKKELTLSFMHKRESFNVKFPANFNVTVIPAKTQAMLGVELLPSAITLHTNPFKQFKETVEMTFRTLGSLLNPKSDIGVQHLMGPPGIIRALHSFSVQDIRLLLWLVIVINVNLGILNLLPIPVLDGGHMLFATIHKVTGRPLPAGFIATVQGVFMILLFSLMIYVSFFDIRRWRGDTALQEETARENLLSIPTTHFGGR